MLVTIKPFFLYVSMLVRSDVITISVERSLPKQKVWSLILDGVKLSSLVLGINRIWERLVSSVSGQFDQGGVPIDRDRVSRMDKVNSTVILCCPF